jgi:predicted phage terminase large subunit-like protein
LHIYGSSDYAVTDEGGDFTEHGVVGVDPDGDIWVKDWWAKQTEADKWIDSLLDLIKKHKPFCWFGEGGVIKRAINPFLVRRMQERKIFCRHEWITSVKDKPTRARGFQARASAGKVHLPVGEIGDGILDQCLRFPSGSHDDSVDVLSLFCMALDLAHPGIVIIDPKLKNTAQAHIDMITRPIPQDSHEKAIQEQVMQQELYNQQEEDAQLYTRGEYSDVDGR